MKPIIFWGCSSQARVLNEFLCDLGYQLIAAVDRDTSIVSPFEGTPLYGSLEDLLDGICREETQRISFAAAIGGLRGVDRLAIHGRMIKAGFVPARLIHPTAYVARGVRLGEGVQILAKAVVGVDAVLGDECIVNTAASVDHECVLGGGVHICPGAVLLGNVHVERGATVGAGAVLFPRVKIGERSVVGAGAVVRHDVPDGTTVVGNPARILSR